MLIGYFNIIKYNLVYKEYSLSEFDKILNKIEMWEDLECLLFVCKVNMIFKVVFFIVGFGVVMILIWDEELLIIC